MKEIKAYTISIFTENLPGLLHRITTVFTRRKINLESFTASESEIEGIYRFTIVVKMAYEDVYKVVKQLDKIIGVFNAFVDSEEGVVHQEVALYKMKTKSLVNGKLEEIIRKHNARILTVEPDYLVIERTGKHEETQELLLALRPYGVLEFARSGLVSVMKRNYNLDKYTHKVEN
ncbi:MAG: acetolactate synthase small subunit [Bacteroidota bacterium]